MPSMIYKSGQIIQRDFLILNFYNLFDTLEVHEREADGHNCD